jgi:hypothetical protein
MNCKCKWGLVLVLLIIGCMTPEGVRYAKGRQIECQTLSCMGGNGYFNPALARECLLEGCNACMAAKVPLTDCMPDPYDLGETYASQCGGH